MRGSRLPNVALQLLAEVPDADLLGRYAQHREDDAFAQLVARYSRLVWGQCRNLLPDAADAEDAFQATFLALARSAERLPSGMPLGPWLHGVAYRVCQNARRAMVRRTRRERASARPEAGRPVADSAWEAAFAAVAEEVQGLAAGQRAAFVLCCIEGRNTADAAALLGTSPGALAVRLARAKQALLERMARRGLGAGILTLGWLTSGGAAPAALVRLTLSLVAAGVTVPGSVQSLTHGVVGMTTTRFQLLAAAVLVATGLGLGAGWYGAATARPGAQPPSESDPLKGVPTARGAPGADAPKGGKPDDETAVAAHIKALHAADSETRASAATALRRIVAKYPSGTVYLSSKDGGEAAWRKKVEQVDAGTTKTEVLKLLPSFAATSENAEVASGDSHVVAYRLDYHWIVRVTYRNTDKVIERPVLIKHALRVHPAPPKDFSGTWTTWHVNGQKGYEIQYKDGKYDGVFTCYHDNGRKSYEQHYVNHIAHGADTGWQLDGKPAYTAQYRDGKQDGTWTHWHANGNKHSEERYANGKLNGRKTYWHENGQIGSVNDYVDGVKNGIEASWKENGELQYERVLSNGEVVKVLK